MSDILFLDLPRRLAKLLLFDAVTRQSLNKALSGLARRGWIEVDGHDVVLRDIGALARYVAS